MKTVISFVAIGCVTALASVAGEPPSTKSDAGMKQRTWWISGVAGIKEMALGKGAFYTIGIYVASQPPDFVYKLERESWEGTNVFPMPIASFWEPQELPGGLKAREIRFMGGDVDVQSFLKEGAIRLKGETEWVRFADFITMDKDGQHYYVSRCVRCAAALPKNAVRCPTCKAAFGSMEAQRKTPR